MFTSNCDLTNVDMGVNLATMTGVTEMLMKGRNTGRYSQLEEKKNIMQY